MADTFEAWQAGLRGGRGQVDSGALRADDLPEPPEPPLPAEAALDSLADSVLILEAFEPGSPRVVFANAGFALRTGYLQHEVLGGPMPDLKGPRSDAQAAERLERALRVGEAATELVLHQSRSGEEFWHEVTVSPLASRGPPRWLVVGRDVTRRLARDAEIAQAEKMEAIGRLAGGVAHELNNLLTVITGFGDLVQMGLDDDSPLRDDMSQIRQAADRAASITAQLLAFSRKQVLQPRPLDLSGVIADLDATLRQLAGADIEVVPRLDADLGHAHMDVRQLEQLVITLAVHARDEMPDGGVLTLDTRNVDVDAETARLHAGLKPGAYVQLLVSDTGAGFGAATRQRIFEPFFSSRVRGISSGIGLASAYGIVQQCGGHIEVDSIVGRGTSFRVLLPRIARVVPAPARTEPLRDTGGHETVLLVEDEELVRRLARDILQRKGYRVLEATSGSEALRIADEYPGAIDLVLTDVAMPRMTGPELADRLAPLRPDARVLFMSGYTDKAIVFEGVLRDGVAFLQKPFTPDALARHVRRVLDLLRRPA